MFPKLYINSKTMFEYITCIEIWKLCCCHDSCICYTSKSNV